MKVSELARRAGVAASAVRFYEAEGVLPAARRTAAGYRQYAEIDVCRLRVLVALRSLGIDLEEAGHLASMCSEGRCDDMAADLLPRVLARRAEVAQARAELEHLDAALAGLEQTIEAGGALAALCVDERLDDTGACTAGACCEGTMSREGRSEDDSADRRV